MVITTKIKLNAIMKKEIKALTTGTFIVNEIHKNYIMRFSKIINRQ